MSRTSLANKSSPIGAGANILGVNISPLTMDTTIEEIERWVQQGEKQYVAICTTHSILEAQQDPDFASLLNRAALRTPDGMPLVWLSRRYGFNQVERVYGPDLMLALCARSIQTGHRHFFYGGIPGVTHQLLEHLTDQFPGMNVAGSHTPGQLEIGEFESDEVLSAINASNADIVWVGLGCPKQEWWVANHREALTAPVLIAVGAAFDIHSGTVRQAPRWMQRNGLEWLCRLTQDPTRLWKRYLIGNTNFVCRIVASEMTPRARSRNTACRTSFFHPPPE